MRFPRSTRGRVLLISRKTYGSEPTMTAKTAAQKPVTAALVANPRRTKVA
ncbi:hypothetical protein ABLE68_19820 [Nocardioides sp. CN2-186]